ncbi:MAG: hypothetical protein JXA33_03785, partial [Anaerolineae bacterium]|nr:hypothetical protein [Anaerolineae bacterium]
MMNQTLIQLMALGVILVAATAFAIYGIRYRNQSPSTRSVPVFHSLTDEVGRVAEEGASVHVALGNGSLIGDDAMTSVAALQGLSALF